MAERPIPAGLQVERTLLAWRRTCLALALGYLLWIRIVSERFGAGAIAIGLVGLVAVVAAWFWPQRRYRLWLTSTTTDPASFRLGGAPFAFLAGICVAAGLFAVVVVALY